MCLLFKSVIGNGAKRNEESLNGVQVLMSQIGDTLFEVSSVIQLRDDLHVGVALYFKVMGIGGEVGHHVDSLFAIDIEDGRSTAILTGTRPTFIMLYPTLSFQSIDSHFMNGRNPVQLTAGCFNRGIIRRKAPAAFLFLFINRSLKLNL